MSLPDNRLDNQINYENTAGTSKLVKTTGYNSDGSAITVESPLPVEAVVDGDPVSKDNPSHSTPTDHSGRVGMMSVFGDQIVGHRIAQVSGQFKYGLPSGASTQTIVGSGSISVSESMLVISTGTDTNGSASISNRRPIRYIPGYDTFMNWTAVYSAPKQDSYQRAGLFDDQDGFFLGYEDDLFGFTIRRLGTDTFYPIDLSAFTEKEGYVLDPTKGNVYRLNYGYLGFATILVDIMEPGGNWASLIKVEYPNTSIDTHITQTFLEPRFEVANTGNNTDMVAKSGSFNAGIIDGGGVTPSTRTFSHSGTFGPISGDQDVIAYRNKAIFNTFTNKIPSLASWLSVAVEGNKPFIIELILNPTENVAGTWTDVDLNDSTTEFSTNTTWLQDGKLLLPFSLAKVGELDKIIKDLNIEWLPGDILLIRVITSSVGYDVTLGFKWEELF